MNASSVRKASSANRMSIRQLFAPALLAIAILPLAVTAQANSQVSHERQGPNRMEERRQEVYERADISAEKQAALNEAHAEHRAAMQALREEHHARVAEILTEEEQAALRNAMQAAHAEFREQFREQHGQRGGHNENIDENVDSK